MRVASHLGSTSGLADAKDLIRAGIDGFAHTVRDRDIDEEYMALVFDHPDVWTIPNLPGSPVTLDDLPWLSETLPPFEIENLRQQAERLAAEGPGEFFALQCRNLARNREAGMIIGMGTDSGVSVAWTTHTEIRDMAGCGLTPMEAIEAATRINAEILGWTTSAPWPRGRTRRSWCWRRTRWTTSPTRGGSTASTCAVSRWTAKPCGRSSWTASGRCRTPAAITRGHNGSWSCDRCNSTPCAPLRYAGETMLRTIEGVYRDGRVELSEVPGSVAEDTRVIVTFLENRQVDLRARGIDEEQAARLRTQLKAFTEEWNSPEMASYDDYDAAKHTLNL